MKIATNIAGVLLFLVFTCMALLLMLKVIPMPPPPPEGTPAAMFMGAVAPTGYLTMIQLFEMIGGILVVIPKTRNFGLLVLGPIIVNILAFHIFIMKGEGLFNPPVILVSVLAAFLLWAGRKSFAGLMN